MKCINFSLMVFAISQVTAYPFVTDPEAVQSFEETLEKRQGQGKGAFPAKPPPFDAKEQFISNQGKYKFIAPTATDTRGPCPGLNVMSNHGYLPRNGRGTIQQFSEACQKVYGMSPQLAFALATFGATNDGNLLSWSVGGKPHTGISGAHSNYESDSSIIRGDLHQYGNSDDVQMSQFMALYNLQPNAETANYNMEVLREYRKTRWEQSVNGNPVFFYEPFSGIEVTQAGFSFTYRFFGNKSKEFPEGRLDKNVLKSFYSIYGPEDKLYWKPGYERIPDNWYTRNKADKYGAVSLQKDILYIAEQNPSILTTGCNVAGKGTYDIIDPGEVSNGAYTADSAAKNPLCFAMQYALGKSKLLGLEAGALSKLTSSFEGALAELDAPCAPIESVSLTKLKGCPGFSLYGGPTGDIAPGAVQYN